MHQSPHGAPPPQSKNNPLVIVLAVIGGGCVFMALVPLIFFGGCVAAFNQGWNQERARQRAETAVQATPAPPRATAAPYQPASPPQYPQPATAPARNSVTPERWQMVAQTVAQNGVTVGPYDQSAPWRMDIYLPANVAYGTTPEQAKQLAHTAYTRLGDDATVRVKTASGMTLATADGWGVR